MFCVYGHQMWHCYLRIHVIIFNIDLQRRPKAHGFITMSSIFSNMFYDDKIYHIVSLITNYHKTVVLDTTLWDEICQ